MSKFVHVVGLLSWINYCIAACYALLWNIVQPDVGLIKSQNR